MAGIDVSELLLDADFVDPITIIRQASAVNNMGENNLTPTEIAAYASVQSPNAQTLQRLPEGAQLNDFKTFYSKTPLLADAVGGYSDVIVWRGERFQVINTMPFGNWGGGWYKADAVMERPSR